MRRKYRFWKRFFIAVIVSTILLGGALIYALVTGVSIPYVRQTTDLPEPLEYPDDIATELLPGSSNVVLFRDIYPMVNGQTNPDGYPLFLVRCDPVTTICSDQSGNPISSIEEAAHTLPPVRRQSRESGAVVCSNGLCYDRRGRLVGSDPSLIID